MGWRLPLRRALWSFRNLRYVGPDTRGGFVCRSPMSRHQRLCSPLTRFHSSQPERASSQDFDEEMSSFRGTKVRYSSEMRFIPEALEESLPCYRLLCSDGQLLDPAAANELGKDLCLELYRKMVTLQVMDSIFYDAQRQGRISFYVTTIGEEAINIASAAAFNDTDVVFSQYREPGVLMWRGFTLQQFANQCYGNEADLGKGRQMPVHYGSNKLNYLTVSSPIATQLPQAVGAAYALKVDKAGSCAVTYFGDGGTSEGDFHAAMNFAAVLEAPVLFICRNNGWAISTPTSEQFRSDGVAIKGQAYGVRSIRVDGNDALAVYLAVKSARKMAIEESRPILIEALTYRVGHHSTSDDSSKYRSVEEIEHWRTRRDPVARLRLWLQNNQWWCDEDEDLLRQDLRAQMMSALQNAESRKKPGLSNLFEDVYDVVPQNLKDQEQQTRAIVRKFTKDYPADVPLT
ncbi:hypothetical protein GOP47_0029581 [Adiantum capillus-veneris]|nr:hypothetical protein GOP47_0029136 [Adiantum capillus-veneris]KAI5056060.1 hypothetical protein GOP47_0029581 [Adiantum capillus-veneris]